MKYRTTALIAAMLCTSATALGQDLKVGDRAPKLSVDEWVKGAEFESFQKGKVYIVEFWATWCKPCIRSIPHLSEIQTEHADDGVVVLGVAGSERKGRDHLFEWVEEDDNGKKIAYNVAYDADRSMFETWMTAAGKGGIPTAFLIDRDGKIAYIGHPSRLDKPLKKVLAKGGTYAGADEEDRPFELMLGDKAPELAIGEWVKGKPITGFENGRVYVVEFWATWCGPCIAGMPHLSDIQKEYVDKGVRIIGVNIKDDPENVAPFMKDRGDELMSYTVAIEKKDDPTDIENGVMVKSWMEAAGQRGIPTAFIIDQKGRVAWIGHPMGMDEPLEAIVAGEWNIEAEVKKLEYFRLFKAGEYDKAYTIGRTLVAGGLADNADYLNRLAWGIVDPDNMPAKQDLNLALKAALRASELTNNEDAAILDTVAKVYFDKGDLKRAIRYQRQAVKYAGDDQRMLDDLSDRLNWYEKEAKKGGG
ncbi:MAG: redoxin family protein [Planctomycetes bacterium]|nr:redoxin family protein [Planctomycetota bacterium]